MLVKKYYCDVCKKEIDDRGKVITIKELFPYCSNDYNKKYHTCKECGWKVIENVNKIIKEGTVDARIT